jgi:foldase protein PrsA
MLQNNKQKMSMKGLLIGLVLILALVGCGNNNSEDTGNSGNTGDGGTTAGQTVDPSKVVAEYEGGSVTNGELTAFLGAHKFFNYTEMYAYYEMMPDFKESMLHQLIAMRLIVQDLPTGEKDASGEQAKSDIAQITESIESDEASKEQYKQLMDQLMIGTGDLENYMVSQYNLQKVFESKYSDEDAKKKYEENLAANPNAYTIATVRHILVGMTDNTTGEEIRTKEEALKRAQDAQAKLKSGGDWTALAAEYSDDPGSKENGGQYTDVDVSKWVENFKNAVLEQPVGEIGAPVETEHGYHVILVEKRSVNEFETVKNDVKSNLINEFFSNYIEVDVPKLITKTELPAAEVAPELETEPATE